MANRLDAMLSKESNGKTYWTKIGAAFPFKTGREGYNVVLDVIPPTVDGAYRFSLFEAKNNTDNSNNNRDNGYGQNDYSSGRPGSNRNIPESDDIPF